VHWVWRRIRMLGFTRCSNDFGQDWREVTEEYKPWRCRPLRDKMADALPPEWTVETVCFTLGIRGIYAEAR
jgi:hypothetical protein